MKIFDKFIEKTWEKKDEIGYILYILKTKSKAMYQSQIVISQVPFVSRETIRTTNRKIIFIYRILGRQRPDLITVMESDHQGKYVFTEDYLNTVNQADLMEAIIKDELRIQRLINS